VLGLVIPVIIAALMVVPQERHLKVDDLTQDPRQTRGDSLPKANLAAFSDVARSNGESIGEITSRQVTNVDSRLLQ
jgi:hypothetical protein